MDINELNKLSIATQFTKLTSQPNVAAGASGNSFASLLGQVDVASSLKPAVADDSKSVKKDVPVAKTDGNKEAPVNNKKEPIKNDSVKNKSDNKKDVKTDKTKPVADADKDVNVNKTQAEEAVDVAVDDVNVAAMTVVPVAEPLAPIAEANGVDTSEMVNIVDGTMADGTVLRGDSTASGEAEALPAGSLQIVDDKGQAIKDFALTPNDLVNVPVVNVMDVETGEVAKMSGLELSLKVFGKDKTDAALTQVAQISPGAIPVAAPAVEVAAAPVVAPLAQTEATPLVAKKQGEGVSQISDDAVVAEDEAGISTVIATQPTTQKDKASKISTPTEELKTPAAGASDADALDEKIAKLLNDKQVKVDFKVEEEKISYRQGQDLLKDRAAVDGAVSAVASADASDALSPATTSKVATAQPVSPINNTPVAVAAVAQAMVADDAAAPVAASVSEIGGVTTTASNANSALNAASGELAASAKADSSAKTQDASFKDVYKGMSKEAVEQVKVNITKSAVKGVDTIDVRLKPEDLGNIEIKMQIKGGKLQAHIISSRPETMEALQKDAQILEKAFNDAGFQTDEGSLSFSFRGESQADQHQDRNPGLRDFIGDVFEAEANDELLSAEAANQNWSADKGLNIKV